MSERREAAIHEAGHVVVGLVTGHTTVVHLYARRDATGVHGRTEWPGSLEGQLLAAMYGGPMAHRCHDLGLLDGATTPTDDELIRYGGEIDLGMALSLLVTQYERVNARSTAERIVIERWDAVTTVADLLEDAGVIDFRPVRGAGSQLDWELGQMIAATLAPRPERATVSMPTVADVPLRSQRDPCYAWIADLPGSAYRPRS